MRWLLAAAGLAAAAFGAAGIASRIASGAQPWSPELADNMTLAQAVPFALGLGVAIGTLPWARAIGLWTFATSLLIGLPTGAFEYLGGLLDVHPPFDLYIVYRAHYVGAAIVLFSAATLATHAWLAGRGSLLAGSREAIPLERPRSATLARRAIALYEWALALPYWWTLGIGLITITGVVKAMRYLWPVPGPVLFVASTLHVAAMVLIGLKVLDELRLLLVRRGAPALAVFGLLGALASLAVAFFFVQSAFVAKTAAKEGVLSQAALLVGGVAIAYFAILLARQSLGRIVTRRAAPG